MAKSMRTSKQKVWMQEQLGPYTVCNAWTSHFKTMSINLLLSQPPLCSEASNNRDEVLQRHIFQIAWHNVNTVTWCPHFSSLHICTVMLLSLTRKWPWISDLTEVWGHPVQSPNWNEYLSWLCVIFILLHKYRLHTHTHYIKLCFWS